VNPKKAARTSNGTKNGSTPTTAFVLSIFEYSATPFHQMWCWGAGPTKTQITLSSTKLSSGQSIAISGSVTDMSSFSQQHPEIQSPQVAGAKIILSYVKDNAWTDFATTEKAADGTFMQTWTPPNNGTYKIDARFEGTNDYKWPRGQAVLQVNSALSSEVDITAVSIYAVAAVS
jgi:hypothetical protein